MDNALVYIGEKTPLLNKTNNNNIKCLMEINFLFVETIHLYTNILCFKSR